MDNCQTCVCVVKYDNALINNRVLRLLSQSMLCLGHGLFPSSFHEITEIENKNKIHSAHPDCRLFEMLYIIMLALKQYIC